MLTLHAGTAVHKPRQAGLLVARTAQAKDYASSLRRRIMPVKKPKDAGLLEPYTSAAGGKGTGEPLSGCVSAAWRPCQTCRWRLIAWSRQVSPVFVGTVLGVKVMLETCLAVGAQGIPLAVWGHSHIFDPGMNYSI